MTMGGQVLSQTSQARLQPFETAPRPLVGYSHDYPAGWHTGQHSHPRAQLLYAVSGVMRIETAQAAFMVPPATALFVPADEPHAVHMSGPVGMRALFLRADAARRGPASTAVLSVSPLLRELVLATCDEPVRWDRRGRGPALTALILHEISCAATLPLALPMPRDPRLLRLAATLRSRPDDSRSLEDLAASAGASARTVARLFRSETGISFGQWRRHLRMAEALSVLACAGTPTQAAAVAGYDSQPAFGAAFRAVFGMTPGQARRGP
jgi:AraC-like DNA-binding protein/mannose-6-phosphate isomerase-like protein (cupin superfamily)